MSLLGRLFGRRQPSVQDFAAPMIDMANESERVHRVFLDTYIRDITIGILPVPESPVPTRPSSRGVFKARLFNALHVVAACLIRTGDSDKVYKLMNLATGVAIEPLSGGGELELDRDEARKIFDSFEPLVLRALAGALRQAPVSHESRSMELELLAERLHECHAESIGDDLYNREVRDRFDMTVQTSVASSVNHAAKIAGL